MTLVDRVRVPQEVVARRVGEETVMLHLANGTYYALDPVGARAWQVLEQGKTLSEACDVLEAEYDVPRAQLERDVLDLVDSLASHGLVVLA
jgi:hypothetical protein